MTYSVEEFKQALLIRKFELLLLNLFGKGKLNGTVHTCVGQEYIPVTLSTYVEETDVWISNHRGHGHYIARTGDIRGILAEVTGRKSGCSGGYGGSQHLYSEGKFLSNGVQGGMTPISAGIAFAKKLNKQPGIVVQFLGDGTLGEGTLYEGLHLASLFQCPTLFILENNGYAQSTCMKQTFKGNVQSRVEGFGLDYFSADIWNGVALKQQIQKAVCNAKSGHPSFLEVVCYRLNSHSKGDDNRNPDEVRTFWNKDPLELFKSKDSALYSRLEAEIDDSLRGILEEVEKEEILDSVQNPIKQVQQPRSKQWAKWRSGSEERLNEALSAAYQKVAEMFDVVFLGEDIQVNTPHTTKPYGGAFKVTKSLHASTSSVFNTPISEAGITGMGLGLSLFGVPVAVEIMFGDFITLCTDQLIQHASKFQGMYGQRLHQPFLLRTPMGGKRGYGPTHSQSIEKIILGHHGLQVLSLNYRLPIADFIHRMFANLDAPTILLENKIDYTRLLNSPAIATHEYQLERSQFPALRMRPRLLTPNATLICYGGMLHDAELAAEQLFLEHEIGVEVICPTQIFPLDLEAIETSVRETGKIFIVEEGSGFAAWGGEVLSHLVERRVPVRRAARLDYAGIIPSSFAAEKNVLPNTKKIVDLIISEV